MNVTYLIGNGFDLGIGLKTSFSDFLNYYITTSSDNKYIIEFKEQIKKDTIELWADFEKNFGEYISNFNNETIDNYIAIYEDVLSELNNYLNYENEKFSADFTNDHKQIADWIRLTNLPTIGFRPTVMDNFYDKTGYKNSGINVIYNFLNFNYTNTFDRMIEEIKRITKNVLFGSSNYTRSIGSLIHVHGKLNENMILGVNSSNQLTFSDKLPDRILRRLVKPQKNNEMGYKIDQTSAKCINESTIICIYGMSIGTTDTIWWERIGRWIVANENKQLIYFVFDKKIRSETVYAIDQILDAEEKYRDHLLTALKVPSEKHNIVKKQITVLINSKFMQMNKVKELTTIQE